MDKWNYPHAPGWHQAHIAEHLWLVEIDTVGAAFESRDDEGWLMTCDPRMFRNTAEAVRAYREGYVPNVLYP